MVETVRTPNNYHMRNVAPLLRRKTIPSQEKFNTFETMLGYFDNVGVSLTTLPFEQRMKLVASKEQYTMYTEKFTALQPTKFENSDVYTWGLS